VEQTAGQALSPHAGPQTQALQLDADPLAAPLVPDIGISPPPELGTAVGAAFFAMMQHYGEGVTPGAFQVRVPLEGTSLICSRCTICYDGMISITQKLQPLGTKTGNNAI
jgi:hypothetical protein